MIIVDKNEKSEALWFMLEELGIKYKKAEIAFHICKNCKKIYFMNRPDKCDCGESNWKYEQAGDFTNERGSFLVERKSEKDFYGSLISKKLYAQMEKMNKYFAGTKVLMLEGFLSNVCIEHPAQANWIQSIPSTALQHGISFFQSDDIEMFLNQIVWLDKKSGKAPKVRMEDKSLGKGQERLSFVCGLPGIGRKKGEELLKTFTSPWKIMKAIMLTRIKFTKTGNPKGIDGPISLVKGLGVKFIQNAQKFLDSIEYE